MRILKLEDNDFLLIKGDSAKYFSNITKLVNHAKEINIDLGELTIAFANLNKNNDNYIEFNDINNEYMGSGKL